mmetsp:Transcript_18652/g.25985  ORF Transcript_18652/g.25985 Transcript_18652/m.25985 type:complete len:93 (+) Transcript_18652:1309-1587(+)
MTFTMSPASTSIASSLFRFPLSLCAKAGPHPSSCSKICGYLKKMKSNWNLCRIVCERSLWGFQKMLKFISPQVPVNPSDPAERLVGVCLFFS